MNPYLKQAHYLALPTVLGNAVHDRNEAVRVVTLVTCVAHQHLAIVARLTAKTGVMNTKYNYRFALLMVVELNLQTRLADLALGTLPTSAHRGADLHERLQTEAVVVLAAAGAEELVVEATRLVAHNTL